MTHNEWVKLSKISKGSTKKKGEKQTASEKPFYFVDIEVNDHKNHYARKNTILFTNFTLGMKNLEDLNFFDQKIKEEEKKFLMPVFKNVDDQNSNGLIANITGSSNSSIYFSIDKNFKINSKEYDKGKYKLSFKKFDRTANFDEHCALKDNVVLFDEREKLIEHFDSIISKNIKVN